MAEKLKVYWDACVWFAIVKQESARFRLANHVLELARRGEVEIWTSSLTLAEVFKKQCGAPGAPHVGLLESEDQTFEEFLMQDFVVEVQLDHAIGITARRLLRKHPALKKPADALHLATAVHWNLDEVHTFDGTNLLPLAGLVNRRDGQLLKICAPPEPPLDLFTLADQAEEATALEPAATPKIPSADGQSVDSTPMEPIELSSENGTLSRSSGGETPQLALAGAQPEIDMGTLGPVTNLDAVQTGDAPG